MKLSIGNLLSLFIIVAAIMIVYNVVVRKYILQRFKINKWVVLGLAIFMFIFTNVLAVKYKFVYSEFSVRELPYYICMGIFIMLFYTFFDLAGWSSSARMNSKNKSKDDIVIRPKAKPNRVKNRDKNNKDNSKGNK